jgi:DNA-binding CsgD family transcriptional regulator
MTGRRVVVRPSAAQILGGVHLRPVGTDPRGGGSGWAIPTPRSGEEAAMMRQPPDDGWARHPDGAQGLNERDLEMLRHLADGKSTSQVAAAMSVTSNTARTRIRRVQCKLAAARRSQMVEAARERGVI